MSRLFSQLLFAALAALLSPTLLAVDVTIPDARLEALVRATLAKPSGTLTDADLASLTVLNSNTLPASSEKISDLTGLEYATNLTRLTLSGQEVTDLTPLSGLNTLNWLLLASNNVSDISPLTSLGALNYLDLSSNNVSDIAPLASIPQLRILVMPFNPISDFTPLSQLTGLTSLSFRGNKLTSLDPILPLFGLETLVLNENRLISLEGIEQLANLQDLQVFGNYLTDITPATNLPELEFLALHQNYIDFSAGSANATALATLQANGVTINSVSQRVASLSVAANVVKDPYHVDGGTGSLAVTSNSYWRARSDADWLTITSPEYAFANDPIAFTVAASPSLQGARVATITVTDLANTATFQVVQRPYLTVSVPDPNLEKAIRQTVGNTTEPLTDHQLEGLVSLKISVSALSSESRKVQSLTGLQYAINLESLELDNHAISDLFPLSGLVRLKKLSLRNNVISQLDPLLFQTGLTEIHLENNFISESELQNNFLLTSIVSKGGTVTSVPQNTPTVSLFRSPDTFGLEAGAGTLEIDSNFVWTATSNASWLTFTTSPTGTRDGTVRYRVAAAPSLTSERVATLSVLGASVTVVQRPPIPVTFADPDLAVVLRAELGLDDGAPITDLNLRALTSLSLTRNVLDANVTSLEGLEYATNLESLALSNYSISSLAPLVEIEGLKSLDISNAPLQDLSALSSLTRLESLTLENCGLTQFPELNCEETLTVLDVSDNSLADVSPISQLPLLTYLDISYNPIVDIGPLSGLGQLTFLDMSETQPGSLIPLTGLSKIEELLIAETGATDLGPLRTLGTLRSLDITANSVTSLEPLARLTNLREIYGFSNLVEDLSPILPLPNLRTIEFPQNRIHDLEPFEVSPNTEYLDLSNNFITDISPLGQMPSLIELYIRGNFIDLSQGSAQSSELQAILENETVVSAGNQRTHVGTVAHTSFATGPDAIVLSTPFTNNGYVNPQTEANWLSFELNPFASSGTLKIHVEENDFATTRSATVDLDFATITVEQTADAVYVSYLQSRGLEISNRAYRKYADADGDGRANYFEYRSGFDMLDANSRLVFHVEPVGASGSFDIHYSPANANYDLVVEFSSDQKTWSPLSLDGSVAANGHRVIRHTPETVCAFYRLAISNSE